MYRLIAWLEERLTWKTYFSFLGLIILYDVVAVLFLYIVTTRLGMPEPKMDPEFLRFIEEILKLPPEGTVAVIALAAFAEEFVFRLVPLFFAMLLFQWWRVTKPVIVVVMAVSALGFGLAHVYNYDLASQNGAMFALVIALTLGLQGMTGLFYGLFFLKYCGLHHQYSWGAFYTLGLVHTLWNLAVFSVEKTG